MSKAKSFDSRKAGIQSIKEGVKQLLEAYKIEEKYNETHLIKSWEAIMGKPIASRTKKIFIINKKMIVELTSAPLKHELTVSKNTVMALILKEFGEGVINDIVFK